MSKASPTGGVTPMAIAGRMVRERERLAGMTNEERAWRKQWLKDQVLSHSEPRIVPELEREYMNPIRRIYRAPLDTVGYALSGVLGFQRAQTVRFWIGKGILIMAGIYLGAYYFKYNRSEWTGKHNWRVIRSRNPCNPGDPDFPKLSDRSETGDYADRGFKKSVI